MSEHEQWIEDYLNRELAEDNLARLRSWIDENEGHLRLFVLRCHQHGALRDELRGLHELQQFTEGQLAPALLSAANVRRQWQRFARVLTTPPSVSVMVAAMFIGMLITAMAFMVPPFYRHMTQRPAVTEPTESPRLVAHLARVQGVKWGAGLGNLRRGSHLVSGKLLDLEDGLAEVRFLSGASMILEGPTQLTLVDDGQAKLEAGRITGKVDDEKQRLLIETKLANVTDLGTQFGVDVNIKSGVSVFVMQGSVEVSPLAAGTEDIVLRQGEAWSISVDGSKPLDASKLREQFVWSLRAAGENPVENWIARPEDLQTRDDVLVYYDFQRDAATPDRLPNMARTGAPLDGHVVGAPWTAGRWAQKSGLEFRDRDSYVEVTIPDAHKALTLMASVRLDDASQKYCSLLMSDGWDETGKVHWQVSENRALLALSGAQDHFSQPISATSKWLRLAVVVDTEQGIVAHYVNGEVAGGSALPKRVQPKIGAARLGNWLNTKRVSERVLQGRMDDLLVFNRALSEDEIRQLDAVLSDPSRE